MSKRSLVPLLVTLLSVVAAPVAQAQITADYRAAVSADAPIGYWHMDELAGTSVADFGSAAATGTLSGAVALGAAAPFGGTANSAIDFSTGGSMTAAVPGTMQSAEFWVRPSQRVAQTFLTFGDPASATGWSIGMAGSGAPGNQKRRLVFTAAGKTTSSRIAIAAGVWSMVYVSWGPGNKLRVAINGGAVSKSPAPGAVPNAGGPQQLVVGPGAGSGGTRIDEVALFPGRPDPATHFSPSALPVQQTPPIVSSPSSDPVKVGDTLTVVPGTWGPGTTVTYEWQRCDSVGACQTIEGATGPTYTVQPADAGFTIQVRETGTNASGSVTVFSDATEPVAQPDGSPPSATPVLPPGSDSTIPAEESQAALDAGGVLSDPNAAAAAAAAAAQQQPPPDAPWTTAPAPAATTTTAVCVARLGAVRTRRMKLGGKRRATVRVSATTRVVTVRATPRSVRRVSWTLDGRRVRSSRKGALRLPLLKPGRHVLRGRITPRRGKPRTLKVALIARCR